MPLSWTVITISSPASSQTDRDCRHPLPVPDCVVEQVEKNLFEHRVGKYLKTPAGAGNGQVLRFSGFDNIPDPVPSRSLDPKFLVGPRKLDLPLDHADGFLDLGEETRDDRIGLRVLGKLGIPQHDGELVCNIVAGDAVEEVQFLVGPVEGLFSLLPGSHIPESDNIRRLPWYRIFVPIDSIQMIFPSGVHAR